LLDGLMNGWRVEGLMDGSMDGYQVGHFDG
jgi:hypothetical protein